MDKHKRRILLIEDNDAHAEIIEFYINEYSNDFEIIRLSDGAEAIEYFKSIGVDKPYPWLTFLDLNLPKYSGHEILSFVKNQEFAKRVPIVVFTTSSSNKDISMALDNHANSYVVKPLSPDGFTTTIENELKYWELNEHNRVIEDMNNEK